MGTPVLNVHVVALWEALERKPRSPLKSVGVADVKVLEGALSRGTTIEATSTIVKDMVVPVLLTVVKPATWPELGAEIEEGG